MLSAIRLTKPSPQNGYGDIVNQVKHSSGPTAIQAFRTDEMGINTNMTEMEWLPCNPTFNKIGAQRIWRSICTNLHYSGFPLFLKRSCAELDCRKLGTF